MVLLLTFTCQFSSYRFQIVVVLCSKKENNRSNFFMKMAVYLQFFHEFAGRGVILHCIFSAKRVKHLCKDKRLSYGLGSKSHEMA